MSERIPDGVGASAEPSHVESAERIEARAEDGAVETRVLSRGRRLTRRSKGPPARREYDLGRRNTMLVEAKVTINGSKAAIWAAITNIENAAEVINGIEAIEVLERPADGLVGLRWRETRMLFGKAATAEKWITAAVENDFYKTRAEDNGFVFLSTTSISESGSGITVTSVHETKPQGLVAKVMSIPMRMLFKGVARRALLQDLKDIKAAVERN